MSIIFNVDFKRLTQLKEAMLKIPDRSEAVLNKYLHERGGDIVLKSILSLTPNSGRDKSRWSNHKKHAKESNPYKQDSFNLGFRIYARGGAANNQGSFGYLVFPNEGRGPSNPIAQEFFQKGLEAKEDKLYDDMIRELDNEFERLLP